MANLRPVLLGLLLAARVQSMAKYAAAETLKPCSGSTAESDRHYIKDNVVLNLLNKASLGIDPLKLNPTDTVDPGVRDAIFKPTHVIDYDKIALSDFVSVPLEHSRCHGHTEEESMVLVVSNLKDYLLSQFPKFELYTEINILDYQNSSFLWKPKVSYVNGTNAHKDQIFHLFSTTSGEIILKNQHCLTHTVSIMTNIKPIFTASFLQALQILNSAAAQPESKTSQEIFRSFVERFGTHYQSSTHFGSAIIYEKFYSTKSSSMDEYRRRIKCASFDNVSTETSAIEEMDCGSLDSNPKTFEDINNSPSLRLVFLGSPTRVSGTMKTKPIPAAIHYKLNSISSLFKKKWFQYVTVKTFDGRERSLNATDLYDFFEYSMSHYCDIISGSPCKVVTKGCGYSDSCPIRTECVDDASDEGYHCEPLDMTLEVVGNTIRISNQTIIYRKMCDKNHACERGFLCSKDEAGEHSCRRVCDIENTCGAKYTCYEEAFSCKGYICVYKGPSIALVGGGLYESYIKDTELLPHNYDVVIPNLPINIHYNTLVATTDYFYSCGGFHTKGNVVDCYRISTLEARITLLTLGSLFADTASSNTSTWTSALNFSRNYVNATWQPVPSLPRPAHKHSSVLIGDKNIWHVDRDRIHNFDSSTGLYNTTNLPFIAKTYRHCAVSNGNYSYVIGVGRNDDEIWVNTEPRNEKSWHQVGNLLGPTQKHGCLWYDSNIMITGGYIGHANVTIFNTETNTMREAMPMLKGRYSHAMILYNGYPTVVGGTMGFGSAKYLNDTESYDIATGEWFIQDLHLERPKAYFGLVEIGVPPGIRGDGQC